MPSKPKTENFSITIGRAITGLSYEEMPLLVDPVSGSDKGQASTGGELDLKLGIGWRSFRNPSLLVHCYVTHYPHTRPLHNTLMLDHHTIPSH